MIIDPSDRNPSDSDTPRTAHDAAIADQFTRQAEGFACAPQLHNEAVLGLLVEAAAPRPGDDALDVACGPGSVVAALAPHLRRAVGLDATAAMLDQGRALAARLGLRNVEWRAGGTVHLDYSAVILAAAKPGPPAS